MATYVMSDIHGCYNEFMTMLDEISLSSNDKLYVMGDIIDHGPDSARLLRWFVHEKPSNVELMLGNHEDMMIQDTHGDYTTLGTDGQSTWDINNGERTRQNLLINTSVTERKAFFDLIMGSDVAKLVKVNGTLFVLVHAGLRMFDYRGINDLIGRQDIFDMLWIRNEWLYDKRILPCPVVFGHTITPLIMKTDLLNGRIGCSQNRYNDADGHILKWRDRIAIDCGAAYGYNLGCLRLDDMREFYVACFGQYR